MILFVNLKEKEGGRENKKKERERALEKETEDRDDQM